MATQVIVSNLSPSAQESNVGEFLSFCGEVKSVTIETTEDGQRVARATFADADSVETATLLSGAIVVDQSVTVTAVGDPSGGEMTTKSALLVVNQVVQAGLLKGEELISDVRGKARALDERHGVLSTVAGGAKAVVGGVAGVGKDAVETVFGDKPKGNPTTEQWMCGNQPQWGPPPGQKK